MGVDTEIETRRETKKQKLHVFYDVGVAAAESFLLISYLLTCVAENFLLCFLWLTVRVSFLVQILAETDLDPEHICRINKQGS